MSKYYVHVYGPDDMVPMKSWVEALEEANRLNEAFVKLRDNAHEYDPIMYAVAEVKGE